MLAQDYPLFELVVADNANDDGTEAILNRVRDDERVVVVRSDSALSVTENWSRALEASSGEYFLMIGDDDHLLPKCVRTLAALLEAYDNPECLSYNGYRWLAPGVLDGQDSAYYGDPYFRYEKAIADNGFLSIELRRELVRDMFRFRTRFPLTMQTTIVARSAADALPNGVFKSPFPDHYALAALMLRVERWALAPVKPLVIGISEKSFGQFFFNERDEAGLEYLGVAEEIEAPFPGSGVLNTLYTWLAALRADYRSELRDIEISRGDYLVRQIWAWVKECRQGHLGLRGLFRRLRLLRVSDWGEVGRVLVEPETVRHAGQALLSRRVERSRTLSGQLEPVPAKDIAAFADWLVERDRPRQLKTSNTGASE